MSNQDSRPINMKALRPLDEEGEEEEEEEGLGGGGVIGGGAQAKELNACSWAFKHITEIHDDLADR